MNIASYIVAKGAAYAATAAAQYSAEAFGGHVGYAALKAPVNAIAAAGAKYMGQVGEFFGRKVVGPAIAGGALQEAGQLAGKVTTAALALGSVAAQGANYLMQPKGKPTSPEVIITADGTGLGDSDEAVSASAPSESAVTFSWGDAAVKTAEAVTVFVGTAGLFMNGPALVVPVALAAAHALPEIVDAIAATSVAPVDAFEEILKPMAKGIIFAGLAVGAANIVRFNVVQNAFNGQIARGQQIGKSIDAWLPNCMQGTCEKIGAFTGRIGAGRHAMSPEVLATAEKSGQATQKLLQGGLTMLDDYTSASESELSSWSAVARNVAYVAAAAVVVSVAPEVAVMTGATTAIGLAGKAITYLRGANAPTKAAAAPLIEEEGEASTSKHAIDLTKGVIMKPSVETEAAIYLRTEKLSASAAAA